MPNQFKTQLVATLISFERYDYKEFKNGGDTMPGGTIFKAWVLTSEDEPPQPVRCKPEQFAALKALGFGQMLYMDVTMRAKSSGTGNASLEAVLDDFERYVAEPAKANGKAAAGAAV